MIKVIKREALDNSDQTLPAQRPRSSGTEMADTVNEWIVESRQNKLDSDVSARKTIADWTAIADI